MFVSAIIAEYNPFHNGHLYHINETKRLSESPYVIAIMSGNFVQRGEPAIMDKRKRAEAAIRSGADLVIELPVPWATASAERFAKGAAYLAVQSGVVDYLSFGSETDDIDTIRKIARITRDNVYSRDIKNYYDANMCSYPEARSAIVRQVLKKDCSEIMMKPNNILAIEYIKALSEFKSGIEPLCIKRDASSHDSAVAADGMTSAMNIRNLIRTDRAYSAYVPECTMKICDEMKNEGTFPSRYSNLETAVLADLRRKTAKDFENVPDVSEGIEYRILEAAKTGVTLNEIFDKAKTKRYTHARIRRIILTSFLGITKSDVNSLPPYIRVLGLNDNGRMILKAMKQKSHYPVVTKYSDVQFLDNFAKHIFALESTATDIYNLSLPKTRICGTDMTDEIVYIPNP